MAEQYNPNSSKSHYGLLDSVRRFIHFEASGGILLMIAAVVAVILANSPLFTYYDHILNGVQFRIGFDDLQSSFDLQIKKSILLWINDGFMALFFFLVGLEIKREIKDGELSTRSRALLPALGALGGMVVPALIYWFINMDSPETVAGWAIPAATDIAFALGVLALLGSKAPTSLKILLTAIAVIDDIGAILIIALFYSHGLVLSPLYVAAAALVGLAILNMRNVHSLTPYVLITMILWIAVLKSGVHATIAGVVAAFFIPDTIKPGKETSPCHDLVCSLHPWVAFGILPVFALANAGVPFTGMGLHSFSEPVSLGIILGLVLGKPLGIFTFLFLTIKLGLSPMPNRTSWPHLFAVSVLCGIGFTMSLFIGGLAFDSVAMQAEVRLGVLTASVIAACLGFALLYFLPSSAQPQLSAGGGKED